MKKTLIALAVLATAGAASAQSTVSVSGRFAAAYTSTSTNNLTTGAADSANGLGVTDGNVTFAASEDLGGGLKAGVSMDVRVRGRTAAGGGSVDGRDAVVYVAGGFGTVAVGSIELGNGIIGLGGADAPTQGLDGAVSPSGSVALEDVINADVLSYTSPTFSGFTANVVLVDSATAPGANGMQSAAVTPDATLLGLGYAAGPLAVSADYTDYGFNTFTGSYQDSRFRVSASYDLGVVKLGAGYQTMDIQTVVAGAVTAGAAVKDKQYILGVSAPVGKALVVGANYTRHTEDTAVASNTITGWDLGAQYNLSKRTNVQLGYRRVAEDGIANNNTSTRIRLMHSF